MSMGRQRSMADVSVGEIQSYLGGVDYPKNKQQLIGHARNQGAPPEVIDLLQKMEDKQFHDPTDVSQSVGELR